MEALQLVWTLSLCCSPRFSASGTASERTDALSLRGGACTACPPVFSYDVELRLQVAPPPPDSSLEAAGLRNVESERTDEPPLNVASSCSGSAYLAAV